VGSIFQRAGRWYVSYKGEDGKWRQASAQTSDESEARKVLEAVEAEIEARARTGDIGPITVRGYARKWLALRREMYEVTRKRYEATGAGKVQHRDWRTDESRMERHVLPYLGSMNLADVRPRHLTEWVHKLRTSVGLSHHTIANVYGLLVSMFKAAAKAGLVEHSPCILDSSDFGDTESDGPGAGRYSRDQLEQMIGSDQLPEHARVFVALGGLAGLRLGAIAGLRWGDLDTTTAPLWKLTSSRTYDGRPTKTGKASHVPVHPVLAAMLTSWRQGWGETFGRPPTASDPIVPRAPGKWRDAPGTVHTKKTGGDLMDLALTTLGIPAAPMKSHALRSTFVSIALEDGADDRLIERITHTPGKGRRAFDRYDRADYWPKLCAEVLKIRLPAAEAFWSPFGSDAEPSVIEGEKQWRRRESNPGPKMLQNERLRVYPAI
jgi:integrase